MSVRSRLGELAWKASRSGLGRFVPYRVQRSIYRLLYPPSSERSKFLYVDLLGTCNLRCPSCPVGNTRALNVKGMMAEADFRAIVDKAIRDYRVNAIGLFNWTEPFLHPQLPELVGYAKERGLFCMLSSNLNVLKNAERVLAAGPDEIRISLSGFTQETYGRTHAGGDIETVKANMRALSEAKKRVRARNTRIHVYFHKYRRNLHEIEPMKAYAAELGFHWLEAWAYYMPLERVLQLAEGTLPAEQRRFVDEEFALPIAQALEAARPYANKRCSLLEDQLVVDAQGNAVLCCAVYDLENNRLGRFVDLTPEELAAAKRQHPTCQSCQERGLPAYFQYFYDYPELRKSYEDMTARNLRREP